MIFHRSRFCRAPYSEKVKMALSLELSGILWWNFAYILLYWQDVAHEIVKWHLGLVEVLTRFKFWKKWKLTIKPLEYFDKILQTISCWKDLVQGIAKWLLSSVEALPSATFWKKWNWSYLLNWVKYFDKRLRKHWYWQDLAKEIANWHFLSVEALPISKFWKSENGPISRTVKNIVMKFCIQIDVDKM